VNLLSVNARKTDNVKLVLINNGDIHNVPNYLALFFRRGTHAPWSHYLQQYKGNCVIMLLNHFHSRVTEEIISQKLKGEWNVHYRHIPNSALLPNSFILLKKQ